MGKERETASFACMGKESVGLGGRSSTGDAGVVEEKGRDLEIKWRGLGGVGTWQSLATR